MEFSGVMHITERIDACVDFYAALLDSEAERGAGWARFSLPGGVMLALHTPWSPDLPSQGGSTVCLLRVASLDDERERLADHGIAVGDAHDIPGGAVATLTDPDGRLVQLMVSSD
jgi:predicted enzyme related to lactoylglutathione lyase